MTRINIPADIMSNDGFRVPAAPAGDRQ